MDAKSYREEFRLTSVVVSISSISGSAANLTPDFFTSFGVSSGIFQSKQRTFINKIYKIPD